MDTQQLNDWINRPDFFRHAVQYYWNKIEKQASEQIERGASDQGTRGQKTGGKHMGVFLEDLTKFLIQIGVPASDIFIEKKSVGLPGYYRQKKEWDLLIVHDRKIDNRIEKELVAAIEFKSQSGSFGNNQNNRIEEALGTAVDILTAWDEHAFINSRRPWIGFFMLLKDCPKSTTTPKKRSPRLPHFDVFDDFKKTSYAEKYHQFCLRAVRKNQYSSACLILSKAEERDFAINYSDYADTSVKNFVLSLVNHLNNYYKVFS